MQTLDIRGCEGNKFHRLGGGEFHRLLVFMTAENALGTSRLGVSYPASLSGPSLDYSKKISSRTEGTM
ncbi:uncharacterized protein J3R85_019614 [Psidium guajava]|nr:uncharacterized protein J3R85_019614 [Psidium guajava]